MDKTNINRTIFNKIKDDLRDYGCEDKEVERFLIDWDSQRREFSERQKEAIKIIRRAMSVNSKGRLIPHLEKLARIEYDIRRLEPRLRDHVVHATLSFFLGIYINREFLRNSLDDFQWKVAGLFHDIGYPVQLAGNLLRSLSDTTNKIRRHFGFPFPEIYFGIVPVNFENLKNNLNSLDLIQDCLSKWKLLIDVKKEYDEITDSGRVCHGIVSSLAILNAIDVMYQKYNPRREHDDVRVNDTDPDTNWNQKYFENDIIPACSAIFIHNLPTKCFVNAKINRSDAPLAYLLKLSDCLQEWERPSLENPAGIPATKFDIKIRKGRLVLTANISNDRKSKIREEISSSLADSANIEIQ